MVCDVAALGATLMQSIPGGGADLDRWPAPFLAMMGRKTRRTWAPLYLRGLLGPGERKSLQPMAARNELHPGGFEGGADGNEVRLVKGWAAVFSFGAHCPFARGLCERQGSEKDKDLVS